jgi:hypothetical protein
MDTIKFQNKEYRIREIELPGLGIVLISTTNLSDALMNNGSDYVSDVAQNIDEEIYFFVEENEIEMDEVDLANLICQQAV